MMEQNTVEKKIAHSLFEIMILIKGIAGIWGIVLGIVFFFFKEETIYNALVWAAGFPIIRHSDYAMNYLLNQAASFSIDTKHFVVLYFLFYGTIDLFLVVSLLRGKLWAFPTAIIFFVVFLAYQCYRLVLYHSGLLLVLTFLDIILLILIWLEYRRIKSGEKPSVAL